ncbi:hypothetical protein [Mycobacterium leprae]|uniref:hypothetical protein n=1 Tax=Mycobacterium leprae TaxID=1769 RepID=UPI0039BF0953
MLAYSSITHIGFILTGVIADNVADLSATLFYLDRLQLEHRRNASGPRSDHQPRWLSSFRKSRTAPLVGPDSVSSHPLWVRYFQCFC